jgi:WD40 repeat protein
MWISFVRAVRQVGHTCEHRYCLSSLMVSVAALAMSSVGIAAEDGAAPGLMKVVDGPNQRAVAEKVATLPQKYHEVWSRGLAFSPDGKWLAAIGGKEDIDIWDWQGNRLEKTIQRPAGGALVNVTNPVQFSTDGRYLVACDMTGFHHVAIRIWETESWRVTKDIVDDNAGGCNAVGFSHDGRFLLRLLDPSESSERNVIAYALPRWDVAWSARINTMSMRSIALDPRGGMAALLGAHRIVPPGLLSPIQEAQQTKMESSVDIIDVTSGRALKSFPCDAYGQVAWSPDSTRIAVSGNQQVLVFDSGTGQRLKSVPMPNASAIAIEYTGDGRYLVASDQRGGDGEIGVRIFDAQALKQAQAIHGRVGSLAVSADSKYLAVGDTGKTRVWKFHQLRLGLRHEKYRQRPQVLHVRLTMRRTSDGQTA